MMIVKNCPAYLKINKCLHNGHCNNITNCVIKQICAACNDIVKARFFQNRYGVTEPKFEGYGLAVSIIEKLEVEDEDA